jgi:hypothetical protein
MKFYYYSTLAERALSRFYEGDAIYRKPPFIPLQIRFATCDYHVLLIANDPLNHLDEGAGIFGQQNVVDLSSTWQSIHGEGFNDMVVQERGWNTIDRIGTRLPLRNRIGNPYVRRFRDDPTGRLFFILLTDLEENGLPDFELFYLCNLWQIEHGALPLHAAGVAHNEKLYLFVGPSGAGKSTIASISKESGDQIVDEDQVIIRRIDENTFVADGWGYNMCSYDIPIRAVFRLVQDTEDRLVPLGQAQSALLLLEGHNDVMADRHYDDLLKTAFSISSAIARTVSGFELHFHKSSDFWKLIDGQRFP